jgi:hypothetical protein
MLYVHLLTGETEEFPNDWFSRTGTVDDFGEKMVIAVAGHVTDPDVIAQQFREQIQQSGAG